MLPTLPLLYRHQADREICKNVTNNIILDDQAPYTGLRTDQPTKYYRPPY